MAKVIGLTGGIASGKSTVSQYLKEQGLFVIDADALVHGLQAKGERLYEVLVSHYGPTILDSQGHLDRQSLANHIFSSPETLAESSRLQDDIIREELRQELDEAKKEHDLIILDIPLLFEREYQDWCDEIWLVDVTEETQLKRLKARNQYSDEEAQKRISAQYPLDQKREGAHVLIGNNHDLNQLYDTLNQLLEKSKIK